MTNYEDKLADILRLDEQLREDHAYNKKRAEIVKVVRKSIYDLRRNLRRLEAMEKEKAADMLAHVGRQCEE